MSRHHDEKQPRYCRSKRERRSDALQAARAITLEALTLAHRVEMLPLRAAIEEARLKDDSRRCRERPFDNALSMQPRRRERVRDPLNRLAPRRRLAIDRRANVKVDCPEHVLEPGAVANPRERTDPNRRP